ncbi:putative DNA topoisomerase 3-beta-1 [Blattamonas nauphoetae]|uniref:DNA topoisomerase n=1 Tax=Blattamonas nauphoetae TaxID=2049346 RepID=A0ABQ9XTE8_9EUKA|nr:putative DNA topoisomerase 3-beta-1 [Blattamonas nauphoetae]
MGLSQHIEEQPQSLSGTFGSLTIHSTAASPSLSESRGPLGIGHSKLNWSSTLPKIEEGKTSPCVEVWDEEGVFRNGGRGVCFVHRRDDDVEDSSPLSLFVAQKNSGIEHKVRSWRLEGKFEKGWRLEKKCERLEDAIRQAQGEGLWKNSSEMEILMEEKGEEQDRISNTKKHAPKFSKPSLKSARLLDESLQLPTSTLPSQDCFTSHRPNSPAQRVSGFYSITPSAMCIESSIEQDHLSTPAPEMNCEEEPLEQNNICLEQFISIGQLTPSTPISRTLSFIPLTHQTTPLCRLVLLDETTLTFYSPAYAVSKMPSTVFMIAEKPSIAESIAKALSRGRFSTRRAKSLSIHEFTADFQHRQNCHFKVTGVFGHIFSTDFPSKYNSWQQVKPVELFGAPVVKVEEKGKSLSDVLASEARSTDYVVLCLDCDREGENICFEVLSIIENYLIPHRGEQQIFRAKFSAVTAEDMNRAMRNLVQPNLNESLAVDARQELDLKVGVAFTRYQTMFFQDKYGDLNSALISYGPCQTPTLGFCVERHDQIQQFVPESYYMIIPSVTIPTSQSGGSKMEYQLDWERNRVFDEDVAKYLQSLMNEKKVAQVVSVSTKTHRQPRPVPMNTVAFLKTASNSLGLSSYEALNVAESIYTRGFMSYPRTESTAYPSSFNTRHGVSMFMDNEYWRPYAQIALAGPMSGRGGVDVGDHPPLTPTKALSPNSELSGIHWKVYEMVTRHFLASLAPDCETEHTTAQFSIAHELFTLKAHQTLKEGFTAIQHWLQSGDTQLPPLTKGQTVPVTKIKLQSDKTRPPSYLSEADLIGLMEQHGIGTDASIPTHINSITTRNYIRVDTNGGRRSMIPTPLGIMLVHGYYKIDPDLVLPRVRKEVEGLVGLIAEGKAEKAAVVLHSINNFRQKFEFFSEHINLMNELFESTFSKLAECGKPFTRCGQCNRFMNLIASRPARLFCATCDLICYLPDNASYKENTGQTCPTDRFEVIQCTFKSNPKLTISLCPFCYTFPPEEFKMQPSQSLGEKNMRCQLCPNPHCRLGMHRNTIGPCLDDQCTGILVLDSMSMPNLRINCTTCKLCLVFDRGIQSIVPSTDTLCQQCQEHRMLQLTINKKDPAIVQKLKDLLPPDSTKMNICVGCDEVVNVITEEIELQEGTGGRGRFRGRGGRGGRGRGRGRGRRGGRGRGGRRLGQEDGYEWINGELVYNPYL